MEFLLVRNKLFSTRTILALISTSVVIRQGVSHRNTTRENFLAWKKNGSKNREINGSLIFTVLPCPLPLPPQLYLVTFKGNKQLLLLSQEKSFKSLNLRENEIIWLWEHDLWKKAVCIFSFKKSYCKHFFPQPWGGWKPQRLASSSEKSAVQTIAL